MPKRTVTVIGTGRAAVTPDVVRLDLRVGHDAADVASALSGASKGIAAVGTVVRSQGIADADIRTLDATVTQRYDNTGTAVGFTAQQRLGVTVRRLEAVGSVLESAAAEVGNALLVDQVRLDVADRSEGLARARDAAYAEARTKAEQYAALSGSELGEVLGVTEAGATPLPAARAMGLAAREMAASMPVEGGDLEITASVTVTWELR
ncbi:SIMPL domain-containing protein [Intrasporangium sp.]|uniref:SIMPL domain-containing protein n=1 Tax=Intrasporangium sp. TaxID=1925024 RepID=UPI00293AC106|nr:SIMPL domain-containing protein [Intrasporangium sp.]MDV3222282.1 SIMPL domain-containing protein [Intrasporangium sp.]